MTDLFLGCPTLLVLMCILSSKTFSGCLLQESTLRIVYYYKMSVPEKELKKFVLVQFKSGGTNDVVPKSWLIEKNTKCLWPNEDFNGNIQIMTKNQYAPLPGWNAFKCEVLCHSSKLAIFDF